MVPELAAAAHSVVAAFLEEHGSTVRLVEGIRFAAVANNGQWQMTGMEAVTARIDGARMELKRRLESLPPSHARNAEIQAVERLGDIWGRAAILRLLRPLITSSAADLGITPPPRRRRRSVRA
jgi:hypothetical protein